MKSIIRIFMSLDPGTRWTVLFFLVLSSLTEGFGIASLLPLLSLVDPSSSGDASPLTEYVEQGLAFFGLEPTLVTLLFLLVGMTFATALLRMVAARQVGFASVALVTRLRKRIIDNLLSVNWSFFTHQPVGRFANAISLEASRSAQAYMLAVHFVASALRCLLYIGLAVLISWKLALFATAIGAVLLLVLNPLVRLSKRAGNRQTKHTRQLVIELNEALTGIKPIKAMARQEQYAEMFRDRLARLKRALRLEVITAFFMGAAREPIYVSFMAVGFYVAVAVWSVPLAVLMVMGVMTKRTVKAISDLQKVQRDAAIVEAAYDSVHNILAESSENREPAGGIKVPTLETGCSLRNISFSFGNNPVLQGVSLEIPANKVTVLIGASGVGKTTLTDILLGLYRPQEGEVLIDGVPLREINLQSWRSMIGYVPQELILFNDTILNNLTLGDRALTAERAEEALRAADAWDFVRNTPNGILTMVGERGLQISGGQRQRIALARALVHNPKLLILDEVTSALDPETELAICRNIRDIAGGRTILSITHRPAWLDAADQVYELGADQVETTRDEDEPAII